MTPETRPLLRELSEAFGILGAEDEVRGAMARYLAPFAGVTYHRLGSLIAKNGETQAEPRVMLRVQMDAAGLAARQITEDGLLRSCGRLQTCSHVLYLAVIAG